MKKIRAFKGKILGNLGSKFNLGIAVFEPGIKKKGLSLLDYDRI
jgi:hypothetical protein